MTKPDTLDPRFRACFNSLPARTQKAIAEGNPRAVERLYRMYDLVLTGAPNRAERRKMRRKK
jgi:hypothetical protein